MQPSSTLCGERLPLAPGGEAEPDLRPALPRPQEEGQGRKLSKKELAKKLRSGTKSKSS